MTFAQKIILSCKAFARHRQARKLVREMERALPDMVAEMDRMVGDMKRAEFSIGDVIAEARKYNHVITLPAEPAEPAAADSAPPFDPQDCTVLQNPIVVARRGIRVRRQP